MYGIKEEKNDDKSNLIVKFLMTKKKEEKPSYSSKVQ